MRVVTAAVALVLMLALTSNGLAAPELGVWSGASPDHQAVQAPHQPTRGMLLRPTSALAVTAINDGPTGLGQVTSFGASAQECMNAFGESYSWQFGDGQTGEGRTTQHTYLALGTYTATVHVSCYVFLWGWQSGDAATVVQVVEEPIAGLEATSDSPTLLGTTTHLSATVTAGSTITYTWSLGDGTTGQGQAVSHVYPALGAYTAIVTATNSLGAMTDTTTVFVSPFHRVAIDGPGISDGDAVWGDYDHDGDLDFVISGLNSDNTPLTMVYRNQGGSSFVAVADSGLPNVYKSALAWGDYDGDGYLDLLLTGCTVVGNCTAANRRSAVYRYNGASFSLVANLTSGDGVYDGAVAWFDHDHDGDLDAVVNGCADQTCSTNVLRVHVNTGGAFSNVGARGLPAMDHGALAVADYDEDGRQDVLATGCTERDAAGVCTTRSTRLYRNTGSAYIDSGYTLYDVERSSAAWGDWDNDGDLDFVVAGWPDDGHLATRVFHHNADGSFSSSGTLGLPNVGSSGVAWGDYDSDGRLDVLITGRNWQSRIMHNEGGSFTDQLAGLPAVTYGSVAWGDYDTDGRLDALLVGSGEVHLFHNHVITDNTLPSPPTGTTQRALVSTSSAQITLGWQPGSDSETPVSGLYYNYRVGTTSGGIDVAPPLASSGGWLRAPTFGNAGSTLTVTLSVSIGQHYFWAPQTIDPQLSGSGFAAERNLRTNWFGDYFDEEGLSNPFAGVRYATTAWGDYDRDGDQDAFVMGWGDDATYIARVYRNDGAAGFSQQHSLPGTYSGAAAWGDYDNDGNLDLVYCGGVSGSVATRLYHGPNFAEVSAGFAAVGRCGLAWADFSSDGRLDLIVAGQDSGGDPGTHLYRNMGGGTFAEVANTGLPDLRYATTDWGDFDADGWPDLLLTGIASNNLALSRVYRNLQNGSFHLEDSLAGVYGGGADWGDFDYDGDLDIVVSGADNPSSPSPLTRIYEQAYPGHFYEIYSEVANVAYGSASWGDFDSDGALDLLLTGEDSSGAGVAKVYRNVNRQFYELDHSGLRQVDHSYGDWGDFDGDGRLDILLAGAYDSGGTMVRMARIYRGNAMAVNDPPTAPTNLSASVSGMTVTLSWAGSTDAESDSYTLGYNVRVGTTPGGSQIVSAQSITVAGSLNGRRLVPDLGNAGTRTSMTLRGVPAGTYYWSAQAVDIGFGGSPFAATEGTFTIPLFSDEGASGLPAFVNGALAWGDYDNDGDLDLLLTGRRGSAYISKVYRNDNGALVEAPGAGLTGVYLGAGAWGDYDNDGDLDVLATGLSGTGYLAGVYRNNRDGTFSNAGLAMTGVYNSAVAWGDYDRDGDLDFVIAGDDGIAPLTRVYLNNGGGSFADSGVSLPGVAYGSVAWGDYDRDGDLDLFLAGCTDSGCGGSIAAVYKVQGVSTFEALTVTTLPGLAYAAAAWGDADSDGDLDLVMTGLSSEGRISRVYRNDGGDVFADLATPELTGISEGSVAWCDYDGDGWLDLLAAGWNGTAPVTRLLHNQGNGVFAQVPAGLAGVSRAAAAWGDYDNDGAPDLVLAGCTDSSCSTRTTRLYHNTDGSFVEADNAGLPDVERASLAWADSDNDGDLDLLLSGWDGADPMGDAYLNSDRRGTYPANTPPLAPVSLTVAISGTVVSLGWDAPPDDQTPAPGLSYNIRMGTTPGGSQTAAPMALASGWRQVPATGGAWQGITTTIAGLSFTTFYWSVQAVDGGLDGSPFSSEGSFVVDQPVAGLAASNSGPTLLGDATVLSVTTQAGTGVAFAWDLGDGTLATGPVVTHTYAALGSYTAVVTATNRAGTTVANSTVLIEHRYIAGLAARNSSPTALGSPTTLTATVAAGYGTTYAWAFGDGALGAGSPITHTYPAIGKYTAVVTGTNASSQAVTSTVVTIDEAMAGLQAASSAPSVLGTATLFTATISAGSNVTYTWAFGDGSSGDGQHPTHAYAAVGTYTATVTATNSVGVRTAKAVVSIDSALAGLTATNSGPTALGFLTTLTATVAGGSNVNYTWTLGDGTSAAGPLVSHEYPDIGWYTAMVTASNSASRMVAATEVWVQGVADVHLSKTMGPDPVLAGEVITVSLTVTSIGPFTATQVTLTDPLPPGVDFGGILEGNGAYDAGLNVVRWTGDLASPILQPTLLITVPFEWNDIRDLGAALDWGADDDESTLPVTLPWAFPFFGDYTKQLYVGANGNVGFSPTAGGLYNGNGGLPSAAEPNNRIAAFYADLVGPVEGLATFGVHLPGAVYTYTDVERSRFIVQYTDWADWNSCSAKPCLLNTFQVVLNRSGPIAVYYPKTQAAPPSLVLGSTHVRTPTAVGMENASGEAGLLWPGQVAAGTGWMYRPVVTHTLAYTAVVRPEVRAWTVLSSTAFLASTSVDGDVDDNKATASIRVNKAELEITKSVSPGPVNPWDTITYTLVVTNSGTFTLHTTITDILPLNLSLTGILTWTPVLPSPWGVWSTTVTAHPRPAFSGTLVNLVTVSSSEGATGTARADVSVIAFGQYLPVIGRAP